MTVGKRRTGSLSLALALLTILASCGGANEADSDVRATLPDRDELRQEVFSTGTNQVGMTDAGSDAWFALAEDACDRGAWAHDVARSLGEEFLSKNGSESSVSVDQMASAVWLVAVTACRDRFPPSALDLGPPGLVESG